MGVAPILPIYSSGILPKHVFPGAIHRIKRYSYYPIIPGLSLLTGANGSSAAEKPPKYEHIWETWLLSDLPLSRLCKIIQDVYAACIYWIRCQWLFILVYNSTSYCNILLSFGAAKLHRQFGSCEFKMIHTTDFASSILHDVIIRYLTEYWKLWNTCIIFHFLVLQNQWTEPGSRQVDSLEGFCGAILSPW